MKINDVTDFFQLFNHELNRRMVKSGIHGFINIFGSSFKLYKFIWLIIFGAALSLCIISIENSFQRLMVKILYKKIKKFLKF